MQSMSVIDSQKLKVLIAEDEESFRMVLENVLETGGEYEIESCESGDEVLDALQRNTYDVLILDYRMPGHSGLNILQWMHEQKMDTPVIMLTGAGSEGIAVEAMKLGAYDYIRKETFEKEHLPFVVHSAHERYLFKQEREARQQQSEEQKKTSVTFDLLFECIRSYGELMNTSLAIINTEMAAREQELVGKREDENARLLGRTFDEMQRQYEVIAMCTKSLLELSRVMLDRFVKAADTTHLEQTARESLQSVQRLTKRPTKQESRQ
jgi:FixJ family two-component response regulator